MQDLHFVFFLKRFRLFLTAIQSDSHENKMLLNDLCFVFLYEKKDRKLF